MSKLLIALTVLATLPAAAADRPNFLLIMVDDMGFSDPGCYGGEVDTPYLDRLARGGLRFTQFYNTARCWPSRAALMTGRYPHEAGHAMMYGRQAPRAYRGTTPDQGRFLPELLRPAGYRTYHVGKWHLHTRLAAKPPRGTYADPSYNDSWPLGRGFDRSYCVKSQNNFFNPYQLYDEDRMVKRPGDAGDYYVTNAFTDRAIDYLKSHHREHTDEPFFMYLAHTAPHFPLHALPEDIERHKARYRAGWDEIRRQRLQRQKEMGLLDCDLSDRDPLAVEWATLSEADQEMWATRMAIHAAMLHCVDRGIGAIMEQLAAMNALENTLIMFLSDNGASAEYIVRGDGHDPDAPPGSSRTYLCLEVGWSNASNTPFREHKMWVHEGGISTPLIAHWPMGMNGGGLSNQVGHIIDIAPTILDLAGVLPGTKVDPPITGRSLVPILKGQQRQGHEFLFWEHTGNRAIRRGNWKLVAEHDGPWQLFDLSVDRSELHDQAAERPELVKRLLKEWQSCADRTGVVEWSSLPQSKRGPGGNYRKK